VTSDGFRRFRNAETALEPQTQTSLGDCLSSIVNLVKSEIIVNLDNYLPFCVTGRIIVDDLQRDSVNSLFDQESADVSVAILCNSIGVQLTVDKIRKGGGLTETVHPPGRVATQYIVQLL
jgi:hypothetical protein